MINAFLFEYLLVLPAYGLSLECRKAEQCFRNTIFGNSTRISEHWRTCKVKKKKWKFLKFLSQWNLLDSSARPPVLKLDF